MRFTDEIVISTPLRTAIGAFGGALKDVPAVDLGVAVGRETLARAGLSADAVEAVIVGNVLGAGQGMNPARQVGIKMGLPVSAPAMTINRVCGSGLQAIVAAAQEVALGEARVVLAGGIENMDQAPFLLPRARHGYRMGTPRADLLDSMVYDGLWDAFGDYHMGITAENVAEAWGISRADADAYALRSHQRAAQAIADGCFADQIVPIEINRKRDAVAFTRDEHVRPDVSAAGLARLTPAFAPDGTVTAGNASGINDGAALLVVAQASRAAELGLPVCARLVSSAVVGVEPALMGLGAIPATRMALQQAGLAVEDVAIFEVNEAFACVAVAVGRALAIPEDRLNPLGGAVALGHPIGASGAVLVVKLLHELQRRQERYGVVTLCIGGGMGIAAVFERLA